MLDALAPWKVGVVDVVTEDGEQVKQLVLKFEEIRLQLRHGFL